MMHNKNKGDCMKHSKDKTKSKPNLKKYNESLKKTIKEKPKPRGTVVPGGMAPDSKG